MKKIFKTYIAAVFFIAANVNAQTGNYAFTGAEAVNFSVADLVTPGGQTWATNRSATPGYFSAIIGATYSNPGDAANVNGYVKKYGNEAFTFPVGDGTDLRTLTISAPLAATDAYATAWISGNPSTTPDPTAPNAGIHLISSATSPIIVVSLVGQWDWQVGANIGNTGTGAGLTITVSIPDMTSFATAVDLRLVGWNGTNWIDLSGGATASGNTENSTLSGTMIAGITAVGIGTINFVLPLKLENFSAIPQNCNAALSWKTTQEINTLQFNIEQSLDGASFTSVALVPAAGNSSDPLLYCIMIPQSNSNAYYRLKMIDIDGAFTYSSVVHVQTACGLKDFMTLYPNPVNGSATIYLSFGTSYSGKATMVITNAGGQLLKQGSIKVVPGNNVVPIHIENFAKGNYFITVTKSNGEKIGDTQRIFK
jgi:hypothetical protein